jgi:hypothetical protein
MALEYAETCKQARRRNIGVCLLGLLFPAYAALQHLLAVL